MNLYQILESLQIKYSEIEHEPICTIKEAQHIQAQIEGIGTKNLFLVNKQKQYYILILEENKSANLKELTAQINSSRLSFASEIDLESILQLKQGSVTPFGIIYDHEYKVKILIDKELKDEKLLFHPNVNTKTLSLNYHDLIRFIEALNHELMLV